MVTLLVLESTLVALFTLCWLPIRFRLDFLSDSDEGDSCMLSNPPSWVTEVDKQIKWQDTSGEMAKWLLITINDCSCGEDWLTNCNIIAEKVLISITDKRKEWDGIQMHFIRVNNILNTWLFSLWFYFREFREAVFVKISTYSNDNIRKIAKLSPCEL